MKKRNNLKCFVLISGLALVFCMAGCQKESQSEVETDNKVTVESDIDETDDSTDNTTGDIIEEDEAESDTASNDIDADIPQDTTASTEMTAQDAEAAWEDFLSSGGYSVALEDYGTDSSLEYTITDLNNDGISELLIQSTSEAPFYTTWVFVLDDGNIVCVNETYGYGMFRYSPDYNAVLVSPETKSFAGNAASPFYSLQGTSLEYVFMVGQDDGQSFYSDADGRKDISDEEQMAYFTNIVNFEWNQIQALP